MMALFSLLFCAACILQGSSTWTAFLSLAFIRFAAQNFHQFSCDREWFYLVLAAAASLLALLLGGWFLFENLCQTGASMGRLFLFIALSRPTDQCCRSLVRRAFPAFRLEQRQILS